MTREPRRPRHRRGAGRAVPGPSTRTVPEAEKLQAAVAWAAMHSVDSLAEAATVWDHGETGIPVAGPGAPLVAEFSVTEFAAAIGLSTEAGKAYLGEAVELRYRLPGSGPGWSRATCPRGGPAGSPGRPSSSRWRPPARGLPRRAHRAQDPPRPGRPARRGGDRAVHARGGRPPPPPGRRRPVLHHRHPAALAEGTSAVYGELDLADALDLDAAVAAGAQALKDLGSTDRWTCGGPPRSGTSPAASSPSTSTPPPRTRSAEATDGDPTSDGDGDPGVAPTAQTSTAVKRKVRKPRQVVLYVHLADAAVAPGAPLAGEFGRVENTRGAVHAEQIRQWCGNPDAEITVQPVLDLNEHIDVEAYEIRGRLREQTILAHPTCVFPWCTRPARALEPDEHDADCDHRVPYTQVKHNCSCNLAPQCRRHHRAKTHGRWTYTALERGTYVWTSPHGYQYLRDHHGTLDVSATGTPTPRTPAPTARTTAPHPRTTDARPAPRRTPRPRPGPDPARVRPAGGPLARTGLDAPPGDPSGRRAWPRVSRAGRRAVRRRASA